jgi:ABC-type branched-subunit amino acid transport system ATPase component
MPLLKVRNLTKRFGGVEAVKNLSFDVEKNEILGLIGPNGSGKTTALNLIMGYYRLDEGEIMFNGEPIRGLGVHQISRKGIGMTFQLTRLFRSMTVMQNMLVASRGELSPATENQALELLKFLGVDRLEKELAGNLSYGQQKLLELGRVLMFGPELIMLDEPAGGVNPVLIEKILDRIKQLQEQGKTFVVVEHNMSVIRQICERLIALDHGEMITEGDTDDVLSDQRVIDAYLGT